MLSICQIVGVCSTVTLSNIEEKLARSVGWSQSESNSRYTESGSQRGLGLATMTWM